ncbi:MAG: serine/threonine-protein kinase [bacterium]
MNKEIKYIGNYKILDIIGKGGMAKIYSAIHIPLNRVVVIKEMGRSESRRRFKQEALMSASLEHPNIVTTHDYFSIGPSCYLVLEYVEGLNLADIIEHTAPFHPKTAALIAREISLAIRHAHSNGILHRDIKPTNILISQKGEVKISDFGVARGEDSPHLTSTGTVVGTPYYMSPEQAEGKELTLQSDIYSLGIVLYEMVTGKKPFSGGNSQAVAAKVIRSKYPTPLYRDPHHSLRLSRIIKKAMKKNLNRRYQTIDYMCHDLENFIGWKKIVKKDKYLKDLPQEVEHIKQVTTIVRKPGKRKRKRQKRGTAFYLYIILIFILAGLIYYLVRLIKS